MLRYDAALEVLHQAGVHHSESAAGLEETKDVVQIRVVRPVVHIGVHRLDGVEELVSIRKGMCFGMNGGNAVLQSGIANASPIVRGGDPVAGSPEVR